FAPASNSANPEPNAAPVIRSIARGIRSRNGRKMNLLSTSVCSRKQARDLITVNMLAMKRFLTACALLAIASSASAALNYKFRSNTSGVKSTTLAGMVTVDGPRLRMDIASGDGMLFKDNALVLSTDGGRTMSVFDPATKSYFDLQLDQLLTSSTSILNSL